MKLDTETAKRIANLIAKKDAADVVAKMAADERDWDTVRAWRRREDEAVIELAEMGIELPTLEIARENLAS